MNLSEKIQLVADGSYWDPFEVLGPHAMGNATVVRAYIPQATEIELRVAGEGGVPMLRIHPAGIFEGQVARPLGSFTYRLALGEGNGIVREFADPYSFPPLLSDFDLHLIGEGTDYRKYDKLGAHRRQIDGVWGVHFGVWAPNARRVSVVGDFNQWDGRRHPMRVRGSTGVWELFIPDLQEGERYKFEIRSRQDDRLLLKADPYGFAFELRPNTATLVCDIENYPWQDADWMERRRQLDWQHAPMAVYEVHLGSWMRVPDEGDRWLTYRELAPKLTAYAKDLGCTHLELLPITEHPFDASWGYQTLGYFAPTSRFGSPSDFMWFVDECHRQGLGVILDWTPAHFPRDAHGLARFDGTPLYEYADPRKAEQKDWGSLVFDYGRTEVRNYLITSALFWLEKYHLDGLRVDGVASMLYLDYSRGPGEWLPNVHGGRENLEAVSFLRQLNDVVHEYHPGVVTIAEESTAWPAVTRPPYMGGLGFNMKWNLGWMNDTLLYMGKDPVHRKYHHQNLTFPLLYAFSENFVLPLSHDEVVHGKRSLLGRMPGDVWQQFANLRLLYAYLFTHPGKKLLFMGDEFGQGREWSEAGSLDWHLAEIPLHAELRRFVRDLTHLYVEQPALHELDFSGEGFQWIDCNDSQASVISYVRRARRGDDFVVVLCNFTPVVRLGYSVGVPVGGRYCELLNSDSHYFGGSNVGNGLGLEAVATPRHGQPYSLLLDLPPLAALILKLA